MLMPSIFGENLFDNLMDFPFEREFFSRPEHRPAYVKNEKNLMRTDVKETEQGYEIAIDLPGFKKENVSAKLENGYLTISAAKNAQKEEKEEGKYIRQERFCGQCSRNFYVGADIAQEDIKARFEDGVLNLFVPKKDAKAVEEKKFIAIEG